MVGDSHRVAWIVSLSRSIGGCIPIVEDIFVAVIRVGYHHGDTVVGIAERHILTHAAIGGISDLVKRIGGRGIGNLDLQQASLPRILHIERKPLCVQAIPSSHHHVFRGGWKGVDKLAILRRYHRFNFKISLPSISLTSQLYTTD